jgi:hypothetical protein
VVGIEIEIEGINVIEDKGGGVDAITNSTGHEGASERSRAGGIGVIESVDAGSGSGCSSISEGASVS